MMQILLLALLASMAAAEQPQLPWLPNIGFLGRGYDIVRANPRPLTETLDAGFVSAIFDMTSFEQGRTTADRRHSVPDYTDVVECTACQMAYQSSIISGAHSYKNSLNKDWVSQTNVFGKLFSFRASEAYMKTVDETSNYDNVLVDTAASCLVYCAELRLPLKPTNLDAAFAEAVRLLPVNTTETMLQAYFAFLEKFGTHVVTSLKAGSLFWQRYSFSSENYAKAERETSNFGIETAAGISFIGETYKYNSPKETETAEKFSKLASSMTFHSVGVPPPTGQGAYNTTARWLKETRESPMPVDFRLWPITSLLRNQFFPGDDKIDKKRELLTAVVQEGGYCSYLASVSAGVVNCGDELPDSINKAPPIKSNFGGTYYKAGVSGIQDLWNPVTGLWDCPSGYSRILIGGGDYGTVCGTRPDGKQACSNYIQNDGSIIPGHFYFCRSNLSADPQGAFFGFNTRVNDPSYAGKPNFNIPTWVMTGRDNRTPHPGKYEILVAYYAAEYVYASYTPMPGAFVGGFYLIDGRPEKNWVNPSTGVTSCPGGYKAHLLFSQKNIDDVKNYRPFESYVCLLEKYMEKYSRLLKAENTDDEF